MNFMLNLTKIVLLIDMMILVTVTKNYIIDTRREKKMIEEDTKTLTPIIESEVKKVYQNTRNTLVLKNVNDVYNYEKVLIHAVQKELIDLKLNNHLKLSRYLDDHTIEMMIKYEVSKLNIMVDRVVKEERRYQNIPTQPIQPTTVDISDSLMV